jgi:site-specific DNA recombinase
MPKKAVIYTRVSLDRDGTKSSPETQETECRGFCEGKGWEVVAVYCDRNRSAFKQGAKRPDFERMLEDIEGGRAEVVVAYKLDRLTRGGILGIGPVLQKLQTAGADMAFVHDQVDTTTAMGRGVLGFLASVAEQESENISRRVRSANQHAAEKGAYPTGGSRQFGYDRQGEVIPNEAAIVMDAANRIFAGESLRRVATDLNARGVRTTMEKQWSSATLGQMLRSRRLAGIRVHGADEYPGTWEPIISPDRHVALLHALDRSPAHRRSVTRHLLTGLAQCGLCDRPLKTMGFVMKNGRRLSRYQCAPQPGFSNCGKIAITKNSLDQFVAGRFVDFLAANYRSPLSEDEQKVVRLRAALAQDEEKLAQLIEDVYVHGRFTADQGRSALDQLNARIEAIRDRIDAIDRQATTLRPLRLSLGNRAHLQAWWDEATIEDRRASLAEAINKVVVNPAKQRGGNQFDASRVDIKWKWHMYLQTDAAWEAMSEEERQHELELAAAPNPHG